jgi:hypothetical protein
MLLAITLNMEFDCHGGFASRRETDVSLVLVEEDWSAVG